ncbi:MAG: GNAT family N-acetyltransferase [Lachnospiraceae bacterium]|nr:GNAT family N-acetyltransferase [Lachnospiraceae bacterium]
MAVDAWGKNEYLEGIVCLSRESGLSAAELSEAAAKADLEGSLVISDVFLHGDGDAEIPFLLYRREGDPPDPEEGKARFLYLGEGPMEEEDWDWDYLEQVYRRLHEIPLRILETERCILRETHESDVDALYELYEGPGITDYMEPLFSERERELAYTAAYRENVYEPYGFGVWTVILKETFEIIGRVGISYRPGYPDPELGFMIGAPYQRQGYALETCRACLDYGREQSFDRIIALVQPGNAASEALCGQLGMEPQGETEDGGIRYTLFAVDLKTP